MQSNTEYLRDLAAKYKQDIKDSDWDNLCPPYFPKTITQLRSKYFHIAKEKLLAGRYSHKTSAEVSEANRFALEFMQQFDGDILDSAMNRLREPYIKKMLETNYQFDQIDLKKANTEYMLSKKGLIRRD